MKAIGYLLAIICGCLAGFFIVFNAVFTDSSGDFSERLMTFLLVVAGYGILGLIFGYLGPLTSWKWGIWLSAPAVIILIWYSIAEQDSFGLNLLYLVVMLASAILFSWLGSKAPRRNKNLA